MSSALVGSIQRQRGLWKPGFVVWLGLGGLLCSATPTGANPLATLHQSFQEGIYGVNVRPSFFLTYDHDESATEPAEHYDTSLFDDIILTLGDVGRTFMASTDGYSDLDGFAERLTNGVDELFGVGSKIRVGLGGGSGISFWSESEFFASFLPPGAVDFSGHLIDEVTLTLDALTLDTPGSDPNGDGLWTDITAEITVTVIPEPGTLLLLGLGGLALMRRR